MAAGMDGRSPWLRGWTATNGHGDGVASKGCGFELLRAYFAVRIEEGADEHLGS